MIKQAAVLGLAGALAISSGVAQAAADDKMFSVGGALYWIDVEATNIGEMEFSGGALVGFQRKRCGSGQHLQHQMG